MNFIGGVVSALVVLFFIAMMYSIGIQDGRQEVALHLKSCLEVASAESICDNRLLDKYLPKKGN
jgi:hypothetical protein